MRASHFYTPTSITAAILLCTQFFLLGPVHASHASKKLHAVQTRIQTVTQQLEKAQGKRGRIEAQLRHSEIAINNAENDLRQTRMRLEKQHLRLQTLIQRANRQQSSLKKQIHILSELVVSEYKTGHQPRLQLLLHLNNPARINRMITYYDDLNHKRIKAIKNAKQKLASLIKTQKALESETHDLNATLNQQREHQHKLIQAKQQRHQAIKQLDKVIKGKQAHLNTLKQNAKRLQHVVNSIGKAANQGASPQMLNHTAFSHLRGHLPWPVSGHIKANFGTPQKGSDGTLKWQGTFIEAKHGTIIKAISAGRVVFADWLSGYGLLLIIDHGKGYMTLYGHNQAIFRRVGTWVRAGEVIASVGNSGGMTQSGVYFAIRRNGHPLNPAHWCSGKP